MLRTALVAAATLLTVLPTVAAAVGSPPGGARTAGPPHPYATELVGQFGTPTPLKDQAMLIVTEHGYRYHAGQQDSRLVVTETDDGLLLTDIGTREFESLPRHCEEHTVQRGVAALCLLPEDLSAEDPLLLEIWPRLGNDFVDVSTLSEHFATAVLGDAGKETVRFGAGWDYFNGFTGDDRVRGGGGNDWIRGGVGHDRVHGGDGDDQIIGVEGDDRFSGGAGDDRLGGGPGDDRLTGGPGADLILCNAGEDTAPGEPVDRRLDCEY